MNAKLITDLEKVLKILKYREHHADSETVEHEIYVAIHHVRKAIEWEKNRP